MNKKFRSILEELSDYVPMRDRDLFIESRAQQVIASVSNLITLIEESYGAEQADELKKRLILSLKSGDETKFSRKITQIREDRDKHSKSNAGKKRK